MRGSVQVRDVRVPHKMRKVRLFETKFTISLSPLLLHLCTTPIPFLNYYLNNMMDITTAR